MARNKAFRIHKERSKWIRRAKYWMLNDTFIWDDKGNKISHPTIADCLKSHHSKMYKDMGTPCSCEMCSYKYNRNTFKKDTAFELKNAA